MLDESTRAKLEEAGMDVEDALNRMMGKDDLLIRLMKKLEEDNHFELYRTAIAEDNYEEAFTAAHALKGVCGNLSLTVLYEILRKEVELLRNHEYDRAKEMSPRVVEEYERVIAIFRTL